MYTLSQRLKRQPSDDESHAHHYNSMPHTIVLETFENLEDACLALARKQNSRKNSDEFFIQFLVTAHQPRPNSAQAAGQREPHRFPTA